MCLAHARGTEQEERIVPLPRLGDDDIRGAHRHLIGGALLESVPSERGLRYSWRNGAGKRVLHERRRFGQALGIWRKLPTSTGASSSSTPAAKEICRSSHFSRRMATRVS